MRITLFLVIALVLSTAGCVLLGPPSGPEPFVDGSFALTDMTLIEPKLTRVSHTSIEVRGGLFADIGTRKVETSPGLEDLRGGYVLPGLMDMHTHFPPESPLGLTEYFGLLFLAHGVTTVRDAGDLDASGYPAAKSIYLQSGDPGPRPFTCGPFVGGPGIRWSNSIELAPGEYENADRVVADLMKEGYVCIKIYDELDVAGIRALSSAAKRASLPAIGHVPLGLTFEEAQIPNTQHLMGVARPDQITDPNNVLNRVHDWSVVDEARINEVVEASVKLGLVHTPTLAPGYELGKYLDLEAAKNQDDAKVLPRFFRDVTWDPEIGLSPFRNFGPEAAQRSLDSLTKQLRMTRLLHERGVALQIGTDTLQPFVAPGASVWTEMRLFEQAGIPTEDIWAYATWKAAPDIPISQLGRLTKDAPADFLVFSEDPTVSLDALDSLQAVVVEGALYRIEDLDQAIAKFRSFYESWLVDRFAVYVATQRLERVSVSGDD